MAARRGLSAALQPEPRAVALQHRAGERERGAGRPLSPDRSAGARHRLHERDEEAAEGEAAWRERVELALPPPRRPARSGLAPASRRRRAGAAAPEPAPASAAAAPARRAGHDALQQRPAPAARRIESLLAQTYRRLPAAAARRRVDATTPRRSPAATRRATRACATSRHADRQAMIATWHEVAELAARECPSARVLRLGQRSRPLASALAASGWWPSSTRTPRAVLAYPITRRMAQAGEELEKGPRLFDTATCDGRCTTAGGASATRASARATWSTA